MSRTIVFALLFWFALLVTSCRTAESAVEPVTVTSQTLLRQDNICSGTFVPHDLDHMTSINGDQVTMFDSNGAGRAVNDLDNDQDLDIVLNGAIQNGGLNEIPFF